MAGMKRQKKKRVNDEYKEMQILADFREEGDERLPLSLMTAEEYKKARKIAERCQEKIRQQQKIIAEQGGHKRRMRVTNPLHPAHELYEYLVDVGNNHEEVRRDNRCVVCGEKRTVSPQEMRGSPYPYCNFCGRRVREEGVIRGTDNTKGFGAYGKLCVVCGKAPAIPNHRRMCASCYRCGDRIKTHDPEKIKQYYLKKQAEEVNQNYIDPLKTIDGGKVQFVKKDWNV